MFQISKRFEFSASHQLRGLPKGHQCGREHGHNYEIEVVLRGARLTTTGFLLDYGQLSFVKDWIERTVEHRNLNEVFDFQPSAENIAQHLWRTFYDLMAELGFDNSLLFAIKVKETPKTEAVYAVGGLGGL